MLKLLQSISEANGALLGETDVNSALDHVVKILGSATGVDRCYIFTNRIVDGDPRLFYTHEWCKEGVEPQFGLPDLNNVSYDIFPDLFETLSQDKSMYGLVKDSVNPLFKEVMESQSILSYLFAPIFCNNEFWGWMGFDNCTTENAWEEQQVTALFAVCRNVGLRLAREIAEKERIRQIERFDLAMEGSQQGLWEWDLVNNKVTFSKILMNMIGHAHFGFEHSYENWSTRIHKDDLLKVETALGKYLKKEIPTYNIEFRFLHKAGYYKWINGSGQAKWDVRGEPIYMVGSHLDINELKQQQENLEMQKNDFDRLVNSLGEVVFRLNNANQITFINDFWKEMTGYDPVEAMLKTITSFFAKEEWNTITDSINTLKEKNKKSAFLEVQLLQKKGGWRWVELTFREYRASSKKDYFIAGTIIDIHDKKLASEKEKELAELKAGFVSLTSHQFRTPLTVIFSNIEVIEMSAKKYQTELSDIIRNSANLIKEQINRMAQLMDNILLVGRYDARQLLYNLRQSNLSEFIHSVIETYFSKQADGRKIHFTETPIAGRVALDEMLFTHVLTNIISNAFKYSIGAKDPELHLSTTEKGVELAIKDYGIGIPEEEIDKVFKSFYRAANTITFQGSGLGLSVAKQFMELLKGSIKLESTIGKGTTVILFLPFMDNN